jgi:hypothetical protein
MLVAHPAHRVRGRPHHHALGVDAALAPLDALEQRAIGDSAGGEDDVALGEVVEFVDAVEVLDAPFRRPRALVVVAEEEAALELAADAAERRRGEHAFRSPPEPM